MSEHASTADVLRGWAADADEAMQAPLLELARHAEQELEDAKTATERAVLGIVAEAFQAPRPEPEAFAVRNAVTALRDLVADESANVHAALSRVAAALGAPVEPAVEAFTDSIGVTLQGLRDSIETNKALMAERDAERDRAKVAEAHLWRIARAVDLAPDDHATLPVNAVVMRVERLAAFHAAVVKALPAVPA